MERVMSRTYDFRPRDVDFFPKDPATGTLPFEGDGRRRTVPRQAPSFEEGTKGNDHV
jgi:hypothetical protein